MDKTISKIKNYFQKSTYVPRREQISELADLLAQLAWIEMRDAVITINEVEVRVAIYSNIEGARIRMAEGVADNLTDAIRDAAEILRSQERADGRL